MALLFLKNALLGRSPRAGYLPIAPGSPNIDPERGMSAIIYNDNNTTKDNSSATNTCEPYDTINGASSDHKPHFLPSSASINSDSTSTSTIPGPSSSTSSLFTSRINPRIISDATIGLSDGLTVPFALTAGLSALGDTNVVIYGGLAELIAGGISMGLGGYLGAKSEAEAYAAALGETRALVAREPAQAATLVREVLARYRLGEKVLVEVVGALLAPTAHLTAERGSADGAEDQEVVLPPVMMESNAVEAERGESPMVEFLMRFHHQLAEADFAPSRAYVSGVTISLGYFFGGLLPLLPYLFVHSVDDGFVASVVVMAIALFIFGWAKTVAVGETGRWACCRSGVQMIVLGGVAAGAAMGCVKAVGT